MKKDKWIFLLIFLLIVPNVLATISFDEMAVDEFNVGDTVQISGYIWQTEDVQGNLNTKIICKNKEFPFKLVPIDLSAEEEKYFPANINLPELKLTSSMVGECKVKLSVMQDFNEIEIAESQEFNVVKDLKGTFNVLENKIQLGETVRAEGDIIRLNGEPIEGFVDIYLKFNKTEFLLENVEIKEGTFSYDYFTSGLPEGKYFLNFYVKDNFGNEMWFDKVVEFSITKEFVVSVNTDKKRYNPKENIVIKGVVETILGKEVDSANLEILLDEEVYYSEISEGEIYFEFEIPETIKSGRRYIKVMVEDEFGNFGEEEIEIEIKQVPTKIENVFDNKLINPQEVLEVKVLLLDQAGDNIDSMINLKILDSEGDIRVNKEIQSNSQILFRIPQFAIPGLWVIKTEYEDLQVEDKFSVENLKEIEVIQENEKITIRNTGNVEFDDSINLELMGDLNEFNLKKKKSILPNETIFIDLKSEVPDGTYDLSLKTSSFGESLVGNVIVEGGKPIRSVNGIFIFIILTFMLVLLYFLIIKNNNKRPYGFKRTPVKRKRLKNVRRKIEKRIDRDSEKRNEMVDFRDRILNEIKKTEKRVLNSKKTTKDIPNIMDNKFKQNSNDVKKNESKEGENPFLNFFD